jgi:ABC-type amino acid transport system permease subunit
VVDLFRALPPLVIIVFIYFGLPAVNVSPSGFISTWLSLTLVLMAFSEEIFWAGITSIAKGQWEAARSTGLTYGQTLMNVVLPQALAPHHPAAHQPHHRHHQGHRARHRRRGERDPRHGLLGGSNSYNPSPLTLGALAYLILFFPMVVFGRWLETRHGLEALSHAADLLQPRDHRRRLAHHPGRTRQHSACCRWWWCRSASSAGWGSPCWPSVRKPWVRWPLMAWVDFFRAFPPLVLLIFLFAGPAVRRAGTGRLRLRLHRLFPQYRRLLRRDPARRHRIRSDGPDRSGAQHWPRARPDDAVRGTATGRAQRAAGSPSEYARSGETHFAGERRRHARAAVPGAPGAEPHLQPDADRASRA